MGVVRKQLDTIVDVRRALERIVEECLALSRSTTATATEQRRLQRIADKAEAVRAGVNDLAVEMAEYVSYCLDEEDRTRGPLLGKI